MWLSASSMAHNVAVVKDIVGAVRLGWFSIETIGMLDFELVETVHHAVVAVIASRTLMTVYQLVNVGVVAIEGGKHLSYYVCKGI